MPIISDDAPATSTILVDAVARAPFILAEAAPGDENVAASDVNAAPRASAAFPRPMRFCLVTLTIIATFSVLYVAQAVFLPITMSAFLWLLFRPMVRWLARRRIPEGISAAVIIVGLIGFLCFGFATLYQPATHWISAAPDNFQKVRAKLRSVAQPIQEFQKATEQVEKMAPADGVEQPIPVEVKQPRISTFVVGTTSSFMAGAVLTFSLAYFLLAAGDSLLTRVVQILPTLRDKKKTVELVYTLEQATSTYLVTVSLINVGLGVAEAGAMWLVGLPNPLLWGVLAAILNFIPYVGGLINVLIIFFVAILTFDSVGEALVPPLAFIAINAIEGNFVTPLLLGRSFQLNPIVVFLSLTLWSFVWGIGGMLLAIPLLAVFKIGCEQFERTKPLALLISH